MFERWADAFSSVFATNILLFLGKGLLNTLYIAAVSIVLSLVFGTMLGLMRNAKGRPAALDRHPLYRNRAQHPPGAVHHRHAVFNQAAAA